MGDLEVLEDGVGEFQASAPSAAVEQLDLHSSQNASIIALSNASRTRPIESASPARLTRSLKAHEVNCCRDRYAPHRRPWACGLLIAVPSAFITSDADCWLSIDRPTMLREYESRTAQQ